MKWFKHDSDAFMDAKLKKLRIRYGLEGYGLYWYMIELVTSGISKTKFTFELDHDAELISFDTGIHFEHVQEIMNFMVELKLFENCDGIITCMKLARRFDQSMTSNNEIRKIIANINNLKNNHDSVSKSHARGEERRGEEKRSEDPIIYKPSEKMEKKINYKRFIKPTIEEIQQYLTERKITDINAAQFFNFYESSNWMRGKTKIKNWKACVNTWNNNQFTGGNNESHKKSRGQRISEKLEGLAIKDIEENGYVDSLGGDDIQKTK